MLPEGASSTVYSTSIWLDVPGTSIVSTSTSWKNPRRFSRTRECSICELEAAPPSICRISRRSKIGRASCRERVWKAEVDGVREAQAVGLEDDVHARLKERKQK